MAKAVGKSQNGEDLPHSDDFGEKVSLKWGQTSAFGDSEIEELQQSEKKMKNFWRNSLFIR